MKKLEGVLLCSYAFLLLYIIFGGSYNLYMNPKYLWLTALSAALVLLFGIHSLSHPPENANKMYLAVIFLLIMLMVFIPPRELGVEDMLFAPF